MVREYTDMKLETVLRNFEQVLQKKDSNLKGQQLYKILGLYCAAEFVKGLLELARKYQAEGEEYFSKQETQQKFEQLQALAAELNCEITRR